MPSNFYATCESVRTTNRQTFLAPAQEGAANPSFTMYDVADRTSCVGRVPHAVDPASQTMLGWVPCSSTKDVLQFRFFSAGPAPKTITARYLRLTARRVQRDLYVLQGYRSMCLADIILYRPAGTTISFTASYSGQCLNNDCGTYGPSKITDSNFATFFVSGATAAWAPIVLDMGSPQQVSRYNFFLPMDSLEHQGCFLNSWKFESSLDGNTWTLAAEELNPDPVTSWYHASAMFRMGITSASRVPGSAPPTQTFANGNMGPVIGDSLLRSVSFRYFKFVILTIRDKVSSYSLLSEFELSIMGIPHRGARVQSPDCAAYQDTTPPAAIVDGLISTYVMCTRANPTFLFDFSSQRRVDGYRFAPSDSASPNNDPVEWILYGSNDNAAIDSYTVASKWTLLDMSIGNVDPVPTTRGVFTSTFKLHYNLPSNPQDATVSSIAFASYIPWYRLEVPSTGEFVVAAFYRNVAPTNTCPDCTSCGPVSATDTGSNGGMVVFNLAFTPNSLSSATTLGSSPPSRVSSIFMGLDTTIFTLPFPFGHQLYMAGKNSLSSLDSAVSSANLLVPTRVMDFGAYVIISNVEKGNSHFVALVAGKVYAWGTQNEGQLGISGDSLSAWSNPREVSGSFTGVTSVCAMEWASCFLKAGTGVYCWGANDHGQLADGTTTPHTMPALINSQSVGLPGASITAIHCGVAFMYARATNGSVWGWGASNQLPFGISGTGNDQKAPRILPVRCAGGLATSNTMTFCLEADTSLWAWGGSGTFYSLGDGLAQETQTPVRIVISGVKKLARASTTSTHFCYTDTNNELWCFGRNQASNTALGLRLATSPPTMVTVPTRVAGVFAESVFVGNDATCILMQAPDVIKATYCWGANDFSKLGTGSATPSFIPRETLGGPVRFSYPVSIYESSGGSAITTSMGEVYVTDAKLEDGSIGAQTEPKPLGGVANKQDAIVVKGYRHWVALDQREKRLYTWGTQTNGELGNGFGATAVWNNPNPYEIDMFNSPTPVTMVCAQLDATCFYVASGPNQGVRCFGRNTYGNLGDGTFTQRHSSTPTDPSLGLTKSGVTDLVCGGYVSYARIGANWYGWGAGFALPMGLYSGETNRPIPLLLGGTVDACQKLAATSYATFCLRADATLWAWGGFGSTTSLGNGAFGSDNTPAQIMTNVKKLGSASSGAVSFCVIKTDYTLWCWGQNSNFGLGLGPITFPLPIVPFTTQRPISVPTQVPGITNALSVFLGGYVNSKETMCVVLQSGQSKCFGANTQGALGGSGGLKDGGHGPVTCNVNADNRVLKVYVNGVDLTSTVTGGDLYSWMDKSKVFTFTPPQQYATAIAVKAFDSENGEPSTSGFAMTCTATSDPSSPWNFGTTPMDWSFELSTATGDDFGDDSTWAGPKTTETVTCAFQADDNIVKVYIGGVDYTSMLSPELRAFGPNNVKVFSFQAPDTFNQMLAIKMYDVNGGGNLNLAGFYMSCQSSRGPLWSWNLATSLLDGQWKVVHSLHSTADSFGADTNWNGAALSGGLVEVAPQLSTMPFSLPGGWSGPAGNKIWHTSPATSYVVFRRNVFSSGFPQPRYAMVTSNTAASLAPTSPPKPYNNIWAYPASYAKFVVFRKLVIRTNYASQLLVETTSSLSSYTSDQVYFSTLMRPVGVLAGNSLASSLRMIWFMGEDPLAGMRTFRPHPVSTKTCSWFTVAAPISPARYVEMSRKDSFTVAVSVFKTTGVDSEVNAKGTVAVNGPHRFLGDFACGCAHNDTANVDTTCVYRNECPGEGDGAATCGPMSNCKDVGPQLGWDCLCQSGYAYDVFTGRALRSAFDLNLTSPWEVNSCQPTPYEVLVSNDGIHYKIGTALLNYSYALYHVDSNLQPSLAQGPIDGSLTSVPGNTSYEFTGLVPNQVYHFEGKLVNGNTTVIKANVRIPCGCHNPDPLLAFDADVPRVDDGKPLFGNLAQVYGRVYMSWYDDSLCENSFAPIRLDVTQDSHIVPSTVQDPVQFSNAVQRINLPKQSLTTAYIKETSADPTCGTGYGGVPGLEAFDTRVSHFDDVTSAQVGKRSYYCVTASGPNGYISSLSCYADVFRVLWEAEVYVQVNTGYPQVFGQARDVLVSWKVYHVPASSPFAGGDALEYVANGDVVAFGDGYTDKTGGLKVHVYVDAGVWPTVTTTTRLLFGFTYKKDTAVEGQAEPIHHEFMCNYPYRPCRDVDPAAAFVSHLSFNQITVESRDITNVPVSGRITIGGTEDVLAGLSEGCPLAGVKVCAFSHPVRDDSVEFGCRYTNVQGEYSIPITMGVMVSLQLTYGTNHQFARYDTSGVLVPGAEGMIVQVKTSPVEEVNFRDVTKETLYVDVAGGLCNVTVVDALTITLTRELVQTEVCLGLARDVVLNRVSGLTFSGQIPAAYFEVSVAQVNTVDGSPSSSLGLLNYFGAKGPVSVNLTDPNSNSNSNSAGTSSAPDSPSDAVAKRTARFEYSPVPVMEVAFWQNNSALLLERVDRSTGCPASTRVLKFDSTSPGTRPVMVEIMPVQYFFTPSGGSQQPECRFVDGSIRVFNLLGEDLSGKDTSTLPDQEAVRLLQVCSREWCSIDLLGGTTGGAVNTTVNGTATNATAPEPGSLSVIRNVTAQLAVLPKPDVSSPFTKYLYYQYVSRDGVSAVSAVNQITVLVLGQFLDANAQYTKVAFGAPPIVVVRDPPGSLSRAWYKNVVSDVVFESSDSEYFLGTTSDYDIYIGSDQQVLACFSVLGVGACKNAFNAKNDIAGRVGFGGGKLLSSAVERRRLSRTYEWSVETASPRGLNQGQDLPGPPSDVFVVPIESYWYTETHEIRETAEGSCVAEDHESFKLVVPPSTGTGDFGLGFFTRHDVETRTLPNLVALRADPVNGNFTAKLDAAIAMWTSVLESTSITSQALAPTLAPTPDRAGFIALEVTLAVFSVIPLSGILGKIGLGNAVTKVVSTVLGPATKFVNFIGGWNPIDPPDLDLARQNLATVPRFQLLQQDLGLWTKRSKTAQEQALDAYDMIQFSGGGSVMRYETRDLWSHEHSTNWKTTLVLKFGLHSKAAIWAFGFGAVFEAYSEAKMDHTYEVNKGSRHEQETVGGFELGDETPGDYFEVRVTRDATYGTYAFVPMAGIASCPSEPHFGKRDMPRLRLKTPLTSAVPPWEDAHLVFEVSNEAGELRDYEMYALIKDVEDDARLDVDGVNLLARPVKFEALPGETKVDALVQLRRGTRGGKYAYDLVIGLRSTCDGTVKDEYQLHVDYVGPCPGVALAGALAAGTTVSVDGTVTPGATLLQGGPQHVLLAARNLDASHSFATNPRVEFARFEYRYVGFSEFSDQWVLDQGTGEPIDLVDDPVFRLAVANWSLAAIPEEDVLVEVRAVVQCTPVVGYDPNLSPELFRQVSSSVGRIRIDRDPPRVVDSRVMEVFPGDAIDVQFSEPIQCGASSKRLPFDVVMTVDGLDTTFTEDTNLLITCSGDMFKAVPSSMKLALFGKTATLTLLGVRDVAGNLAESNVAMRSGIVPSNLTRGVVERRVQFMDLDDRNMMYFALGLQLPMEKCNAGLVDGNASLALALAPGLLADDLLLGEGTQAGRVRVNKLTFAEVSGQCLVDVTIGRSTAVPGEGESGFAALLRRMLFVNPSAAQRVSVGDRLLMLVEDGQVTGYSLLPTGRIDVVRPNHIPLPTAGDLQVALQQILEKVSNIEKVFPTPQPTRQPVQSDSPTRKPVSHSPTRQPISKAPTRQPTKVPTRQPTKVPSRKPTKAPTKAPSRKPTSEPTVKPVLAGRV